MLNVDEMDAVLSKLRAIEPRRNVEELVRLDRLRATTRRRWEVATGMACTAAALGALIIAFEPKSALASLEGSLSASDAQPAIHVLPDSESKGSPSQELWIFPNHMIRNSKHFLHVETLRGTSFHLDNRFPFGFAAPPAEGDVKLIKKHMKGTVDEAIDRELKNPRARLNKYAAVRAHGGVYDDYRFTAPGYFEGIRTIDLYVDPKTNLMRFEDQRDFSSTAVVTRRSSRAIEYPDALTAAREAPKFQPGTPFLTEEQIRHKFRSALKYPEQIKTFKGIRMAFFGALIRLNWNQSALKVDAITQGGAGPNEFQDRWAQIVDGPISPEKREAPEPSGTVWKRFAYWAYARGLPSQGGREYVINPSNDTLNQFPQALKIRVPVWGSNPSAVLRSEIGPRKGKRFHPSVFLGYVTFVSHRILTDGGNSDLDLLGEARPVGVMGKL